MIAPLLGLGYLYLAVMLAGVGVLLCGVLAAVVLAGAWGASWVSREIPGTNYPGHESGAAAGVYTIAQHLCDTPAPMAAGAKIAASRLPRA
jgi:hypothetical protein